MKGHKKIVTRVLRRTKKQQRKWMEQEKTTERKIRKIELNK